MNFTTSIYTKPTNPYPIAKQAIHLSSYKTSLIAKMGCPKRSNHGRNQSATLLLSPTLLQHKVKVFNKVIHMGIEYAFYGGPFSIPDIRKMVKLLIKLQNAYVTPNQE